MRAREPSVFREEEEEEEMEVERLTDCIPNRGKDFQQNQKYIYLFMVYLTLTVHINIHKM